MGHRNTDLVREQADMAEYVGTQDIEQKVVSGQTGVMAYEHKKDMQLISYVPISGTNWYLAIISKSPSEILERILDSSDMYPLMLSTVLLREEETPASSQIPCWC